MKIRAIEVVNTLVKVGVDTCERELDRMEIVAESIQQHINAAECTLGYLAGAGNKLHDKFAKEIDNFEVGDPVDSIVVEALKMHGPLNQLRVIMHVRKYTDCSHQEIESIINNILTEQDIGQK